MWACRYTIWIKNLTLTRPTEEITVYESWMLLSDKFRPKSYAQRQLKTEGPKKNLNESGSDLEEIAINRRENIGVLSSYLHNTYSLRN